METRAPTTARVVTALVFALSCFGLTLFLWLSFGGPVPLKAKGYRVGVVMPSAPLLAVQADVRIAGVPVGHVVDVQRDGHAARVTLEIDGRYAPLHRDVRVMLRRKTLLGEGYVELTPGTRRAPVIQEGGTIAEANVRAPVALDDILATFDRPTRRALRGWLQGWAAGVAGRGTAVNGAIGQAAPALQDAGDLLSELRRQDGAVRTLVRDTGRSFAAIGASQARVGDAVRSTRTLLTTTAQARRDLGATVDALAPFVGAVQSASAATQRVAVPLTPLLARLRPAARVLPAALAATTRVAPELRAMSAPLAAVLAAAPRGLGAATTIVRTAGPLVDRVYPLGRDLVPMMQLLWAYRREATSFAKTAAATQASAIDPESGHLVHYLRAPAVFPAEPITTSAHREPYNRGNAYMAPGGLAKYLTGPLEAFDCRNTTNPVGNPALGSSPPCLQQKPWDFGGVTAQFPRLRPAP